MKETELLAGTKIQELVDSLDFIYQNISIAQNVWREVTFGVVNSAEGARDFFHCPDGCGACCVDFEPDVLEIEALYLALWLMGHQKEKAEALVGGCFESPRGEQALGCIFFDPASPYHCTVYGGRTLICRLFGYSGDRGKNATVRWKPCKFIAHVQEQSHQFEQDELLSRFGCLPPVMADLTAQVLALSPDSAGVRKPLRQAVVDALVKIYMILRFIDDSPEPDNPNPINPLPQAS